MSSLEKRKSIPDAAVPLATFIGVLSLVLALSSPSLIKGQIENSEPVTLIKTHALKLNVDDMDKALKFYVEKLQFEVEDRSGYPHRVILKTNDRIKLVLNRVKRLQKTGPNDSQVGITLQVNDLDQTIARIRSVGVKFAENQARKEAVGNAISIFDPFGRRISLMHQTIVKVEPFKEPRIYNFGLLIPDMAVGRHFYVDDLGFVVRSEKYLPLDLPLGHRDKSFAFMLHYRPGVQAVKTDYPAAMPYNMVVFATDDLNAALEGMKQRGIKVIAMEPATAGKSGSAIFSDSFGNLSEIEEAGR